MSAQVRPLPRQFPYWVPPPVILASHFWPV
jgi:hypothetical protein